MRPAEAPTDRSEAPEKYSRISDIDTYYYHEFEVDKNLSHIISGHTIVVDAENSPVLTKRGIVSNKLVFKILDQEGNDVTVNYNIYYGEIGTLQVANFGKKNRSIFT